MPKERIFDVAAALDGITVEAPVRLGQVVVKDVCGTGADLCPPGHCRRQMRRREARNMGKYILALDQGTTSSRAILFDREQNILGVSQRELAQHYPREGWVEQDAMEIWSTQYGVMMEAIARSGVEPSEIAAIGITNQRETTILWDRATGRPLHNAIVWQCRRTAELVDQLRSDGLEGHIRAVTGPAPRRLLLRHQAQVAAGSRGGGAGRRRRGGRCSSARWTAGWCGSSPAGRFTSPM